jgi:hypothetical protein
MYPVKSLVRQSQQWQLFGRLPGCLGELHQLVVTYVFGFNLGFVRQLRE